MLPSKLIPAIKIYSQKVDGKELSTEQARLILNKFMGSQGFRQRGFETGSVEKAKDQDVGKEEVYDWVNNNPNYYKTMDMKQTMDLVLEDVNSRGGFENVDVLKDLLQSDTKLKELPRVQLARQAALHHYGLKVSKLRSDGASKAEINSVIETMGQIERVLAADATLAGQSSAALRSWTAQTAATLIDRTELAMEKFNEDMDNKTKFGHFIHRLFGGKKKLESTTLSTEQKNKIEELHGILKDAPENSELANVAMRSIYKYMDSIVPSYTWKDTFFGLQYAALLSGLSTQVLNVTSGSANIVLQPLMEMSRVDRIFTGGYFDFIRSIGVGTTKRGLEQGRNMAMDIFKNGARVDKYQNS